MLSVTYLSLTFHYHKLFAVIFYVRIFSTYVVFELLSSISRMFHALYVFSQAYFSAYVSQ